MKVHLITVGSTIADDLDVATMLREDGHRLIDTPEGADRVVVWVKSSTPVLLALTGEAAPKAIMVGSLHSIRSHLSIAARA